MAEADGTLTTLDDGTLQLAGRFDYQRVQAVRPEGEALIRAHSGRNCRIDLSQVDAGGSVFMALLLSWLRVCDGRGIGMELCGVPPALFDMARVSGLDSVLPLSGSAGDRQENAAEPN